MIQITEQDPFNVAARIHRIASTRGGSWLLNEGDDGGFVAARLDSPFGRRLYRSGSPTLVGPVNARWDVRVIAQDIRTCRDTDTSKSGRLAHVVEMLKSGPVTPKDVAMRLGINRRSASNTLGHMVIIGLAKRVGKVSRPGCAGAKFTLFRAA